MKMLLITTAAALTFGAGVAAAQTVTDAPAPRTQAVTKDQMLARATQRFDRRDADANGVIDAADRAARADRAFARMDSDGDGAISRAEWDAAKADRSERRASRTARRGRLAMARAGRAKARMDANGDGAVTRDEALATATRRFERLDANGDGTVTGAERSAARQARRSAR